MRVLRLFLLTLLFCAAALSSSAQVPELINNKQFRPDAKAAIDSIYNFNFSGADKLLQPWEKKYPDHPLWTLIDGMKYWWQVLSDLDDTSHDKKFFTKMKKADYQAGKLLYNHPDHADGLLIKTISNGYIARQYANRDEWLTSLNYARKAYSAQQNLEEQEPQLEDLKLAEGLKFYYAAYLPEAYPVVKSVSWFLPEGDKKKGLKLLEEASNDAIFARAEATYFLGNINYNYEKNYSKSIKSFERLQSEFPNNNYYVRILAKAYYRQHRYGDALELINKSLERWQQKKLPFGKVLREELLTWKGRILEKRSQQSEALKCYKESFALSKSLPNTQHRSFYAASGYFAGKVLYEQHDYEQARSYLRSVTGSKTGSDNYRKEAQNLLSKMS